MRVGNVATLFESLMKRIAIGLRQHRRLLQMLGIDVVPMTTHHMGRSRYTSGKRYSTHLKSSEDHFQQLLRCTPLNVLCKNLYIW
jgi:hypothetical protein